jgi:hypothetical protein
MANGRAETSDTVAPEGGSFNNHVNYPRIRPRMCGSLSILALRLAEAQW